MLVARYQTKTGRQGAEKYTWCGKEDGVEKMRCKKDARCRKKQRVQEGRQGAGRKTGTREIEGMYER